MADDFVTNLFIQLAARNWETIENGVGRTIKLSPNVIVGFGNEIDISLIWNGDDECPFLVFSLGLDGVDLQKEEERRQARKEVAESNKVSAFTFEYFPHTKRLTSMYAWYLPADSSFDVATKGVGDVVTMMVSGLVALQLNLAHKIGRIMPGGEYELTAYTVTANEQPA